MGARWGVRAQAAGQRVKGAGLSGRLDLDPAGGIADPSGKAELGRQPPDERPKADALDHAFDGQGARSTAPRPGGGDARGRPDRCAHAIRVLNGPGGRMGRTARGWPLPDPADDMPDPADDMPDPADDMPDPADDMPDPADDMPDPADETPDPADEMPDPADETPDPADETPDPADETPDPADETPDPADETPDPADETPDPADGPAHPAHPRAAGLVRPPPKDCTLLAVVVMGTGAGNLPPIHLSGALAPLRSRRVAARWTRAGRG